MSIREESPNGPLKNQILAGEPVLACNWGFGIEDGQPYFDTGIASPGQQAHLELVGPGRVAIVAPPRPLFGLLGRPLGANPLNRGRVGMVPLPRMPLSFTERPGPQVRDTRPLPSGPLSFAERQGALVRDRSPLGANPAARARSQEPLPAGAPGRGGVGATPLPPNPPARAELRAAVPANPPGRAAHVGRLPLPANPPNCGAGGRTPLPPNPRRPSRRAHLQSLRRKVRH